MFEWTHEKKTWAILNWNFDLNFKIRLINHIFIMHLENAILNSHCYSTRFRYGHVNDVTTSTGGVHASHDETHDTQINIENLSMECNI